LGFGGGGVSKLTAHTHNAGLAGDGGDLSETLTDMNGVALYSLITDNSAAVAANTAAIAALSGVPSGLVAIWTGSIPNIPSGWVFYQDIDSSSSQPLNTSGEVLDATRTVIGQQFNAGSIVVGKKISKITWSLKKKGTPVAPMNIQITNSTGVVIETSSTVVDPNTLTTTAAPYEFDFAGTTTLTAGDMIVVAFANGSAANEVQVRSDKSGEAPNSKFRQYNSGVWSDFTGWSSTFIVEWNFAYIQKT
tara:strand:+ start:237 stop:980 length:744 start_codon:yes stop_codon:yes gene_type:complete